MSTAEQKQRIKMAALRTMREAEKSDDDWTRQQNEIARYYGRSISHTTAACERFGVTMKTLDRMKLAAEIQAQYLATLMDADGSDFSHLTLTARNQKQIRRDFKIQRDVRIGWRGPN